MVKIAPRNPERCRTLRLKVFERFKKQFEKQERDHDQGENQKLSLYQAFSLKTHLADYLLLIAYKGTQISQHHLMYTKKKIYALFGIDYLSHPLLIVKCMINKKAIFCIPRIGGCVRMRIVALIVSAFELSSLKCRYCASVSTYIFLVAKAEEDNDEKHKPSTQALSYHNVSQEFRVVIPRPKLLPGLHVQSTYGYSKKWFFLSVWSHAQLTLASHCVIYVVTMQPVSAMCDWQVWAYLQICSLHELLFFFLKLQPDGFFSH
ncbi:hypothetical protein IGI04_039280 [Brassica rapa subsp. trilocularis]|uniref:Uncharacterized protein n=1 Tax=Brassica rapa subsp. trilocularis TaxID=1813537 RepID=A0ABQ7KN55_BRACM|nr:hypothetical protein IGI04_039280 [Brassica rapa subsp. trilocularis]